MTAPDVQPVTTPPAFGDHDRAPQPGVGLCLSGGGYRAMLFHTGVLWRLNEFGWLRKLNRISSVSGGSIIAAQLGLRWSRLAWSGETATNFVPLVVAPIRTLASKTIDKKSIIGGILKPGKSISDEIVECYEKYLYGNATLQDLPAADAGPHFVINATNVMSGVLMRFSRRYIADWRVGTHKDPDVSLALAVAASSAFPPVLSPVRLRLPPGAMQATPGADLNYPPYTTDIVLSDGGVYDNLGLETIWKRYQTVLVSDGGGQMTPDPSPKSDWARHGLRINDIIDNQVRALRKKLIVGSLIRKERTGAYWRTRNEIADFSAPGCLPCPPKNTAALAETPTRLAEMPALLQERLINWGYALCDAGMRAWVDPSLPIPSTFPYPASGV